MKKTLILILTAIIIISLSLAGCTQIGSSYKITADDLVNLEYKIDITASGTAKLKNGSYSEEAAPGSASKIEVKLTEDVAFGDLNSNGIEDATVILWASGGGSGSFYYLSVVINENEKLQSTNSVFLGDRIAIENISIDFGIITVKYLDRTLEQSFAEEPDVEITQKFKVQDDSLVMISEATVVGDDSVSISLDTMGLPYSWQSFLVQAAPYDESTPPGPKGLPQHLQIRLISLNREESPASDPIIYIIPVEEYKQLWEENGNQGVSNTIDMLQEMLQDRPDPFPTNRIPVLPVEEVIGLNDLAVQGKYLEFDKWEGFRFVGRFTQDLNPVTSKGFRYIFQGFAGDASQYLVSFFFPVTSSKLPDTLEPEEEEKMSGDPEAYLEDMADVLNGYEESDWEPDLALLDEILASLNIEVSIADEESGEGEEENIVSKKGIIDRISSDSIELDVNGDVILIYLDGYKLPKDLSTGDKVYVEYLVDKIAEQNILKYLEIIENTGAVEAPTIKLEVYAGPTYVPYSGICFYRVKAITTGSPAPYITWSKDDSNGSLGSDKTQVNLYKVDEKYTLTTTAKNSAGSASSSVELTWGCNKPPVIEEIVTVKDHYTSKTYPVSATASDPDGDKLSYAWSVSGGTIDNPKSNPMNWTTPSAAGFYDVKVTVDDGNGGKASKTVKVEVKKPEEPPKPPEITDIIWQWERFVSSDDSEVIVDDPTVYVLILEPGGEFTITADCNTGSGTYTKKDSSLTLNLELITQAICGPDSLSDEYISYLDDVVTYVIDSGKLYLNLKMDAGNMVFENGGKG